MKNNFQKHLSERPLPIEGKGIGDPLVAATPAALSHAGLNVLREEVSLPAALLKASNIEHNLEWMRDFMAQYGLKLAPHGKTTMSPALFHRQLESGAWGITLATAPQVQAAYTHGVRRVLMANQLVGKANMAIISRLLDDPSFTFYGIVDSVENARALGTFFAERQQTLSVLIELGVTGGRTGVRSENDVIAVANEIAHQPALSLAGIEVYEGVLKDDAAIRAFLHEASQWLLWLASTDRLTARDVILTGAGSAWFDVVAEEWALLPHQWANDSTLHVVLRPGCYLTHDVGIYKQAAARLHTSNPVARDMQRALRPALQLAAYVISRPEPTRAILGLGKRDAAFDAGLPIPALHYRPSDAAPQVADERWTLTAMMDQHAFMDVPADADLAVGDILILDISHPCLTFDKWRHLLLVDDAFTVVDAVETFF